jgi:hypothetical protein
LERKKEVGRFRAEGVESRKNPKLMHDFVAELKKHVKEVTVSEGNKHSYLGMLFDFSKKGLACVSMPKYEDEIVKETDFIPRFATTPAAPTLFLSDDTSLELDRADAEHYHSIVAKLLFLSMRTRPETVGVVNDLCTRVQKPTVWDQIKLERLVNYIRCTRGQELKLGVTGDKIALFGWSDAPYGVHVSDSCKSQSGGILSLGIGTIWAGAYKQSIVAKSAGEAELISASDNGSILLKARNFLISQGYDIVSAVYGLDNTSAMQLLVKGKSTSRKTAHIAIRAIRYYWLCDRIKPPQSSLSNML